jgi:Ribbon-helix-helix protein, copG family
MAAYAPAGLITRDWRRISRAARSAGRPGIGKPITVRLPDDLVATIDAKADRLGMPRAEVIRMLLADRLSDEMSTD